MTIDMFTVFDLKTNVYMAPIYGHNSGHVMRTLSDIMLQADHPYARHPEDYVLFKIGEYDDQNAQINICDKESIIALKELVKKE